MEGQSMGRTGNARSSDATLPGGGDVSAKAEDTKETAKAKVDEAKRELRDKAEEAKESLKARGREEKERLEERAEAKVDEQKRRAAEKAHVVASALRDAGETLEREGESELARYGRQVAEQVERAAGYFERNDLNGFIHDMERTAREHAGAFVGGTFAAGLMLGRFLRSSRREPETGGRSGGGGAAGQPDVAGTSERPDGRVRSEMDSRPPATGEARGGPGVVQPFARPGGASGYESSASSRSFEGATGIDREGV